jgi:hypothetical protein
MALGEASVGADARADLHHFVVDGSRGPAT